MAGLDAADCPASDRACVWIAYAGVALDVGDCIRIVCRLQVVDMAASDSQAEARLDLPFDRLPVRVARHERSRVPVESSKIDGADQI